jgi:hypothetical protein
VALCILAPPEGSPTFTCAFSTATRKGEEEELSHGSLSPHAKILALGKASLGFFLTPFLAFLIEFTLAGPDVHNA